MLAEGYITAGSTRAIIPDTGCARRSLTKLKTCASSAVSAQSSGDKSGINLKMDMDPCPLHLVACGKCWKISTHKRKATCNDQTSSERALYSDGFHSWGFLKHVHIYVWRLHAASFAILPSSSRYWILIFKIATKIHIAIAAIPIYQYMRLIWRKTGEWYHSCFRGICVLLKLRECVSRFLASENDLPSPLWNSNHLIPTSWLLRTTW